MKTLFQKFLKFVSLSVLLTIAGSATARAQGARVQMASLDYLTAKASETVDVNIDEKLLQLTIKFFGNDPDDQEIKKIISGLKGVYVKSFEFANEGEYSASDVESIRRQLKDSAWTRIVGVVSKKDGDVEVYLMTNGNEIGGLAVLSVGPKELTVVNIVGPVDIAKLATLEDQFGIPDLGIEAPAKAKPKN
jgi:Domain of unknown function (DUF4252)